MTTRTMHHSLRIALLLLLLSNATFRRCEALPAIHTRVFRLAGSNPSLVSVAPNGTVVSRSADASVLSLLDGYTRRNIAIPEEITYRVHQSRSGQIWSVTAKGVLLYHAETWTLYEIPEITSFLAMPSRQLRQIALLPAEVNHVLLLFPDKLLDFDVTTLQTRVLKDAVATRLGEFTEIQEGIDDSIWISGTFGVARVQGPARHISPPVNWSEFTLPETNRVNNLQRFFESAPGDLTGSANPVAAENRAVVRLRNGKWSSFTVPGEKIRQAWRAWDEVAWGFSTISLVRLNDAAPTVSFQVQPASGAQFEIAVETNGVFWVASSEGLVRYAPYLWRTPPEVEDIQVPVHSILFSPDAGELWLSTPAGLIKQDKSGRRTFAWPEEIDNLSARQSAFRLRDGRILSEGQTRPLILDPETGRFTPLPNLPSVRVHLLGQLNDGSVGAWFETGDKNAPLDLRLFQENKFASIPLPDFKGNRSEISFIKEGLNGDLWICFGPSLARIRKGSETVEHHGSENGLKTERIYALAEVSEGRIWCGTASRIYEYRGQHWDVIFNTLDRVTDIASAQGSIWVSTLSGIHRFSENSWLLHGSNEGLPTGAVYTFRLAPNQQLWAGTSRGPFVFHPNADLDPPRTLPPSLDELRKPSSGEPPLVHFRGQDRWDYNFPRDLLFSYRLDESNWTPFSNVTSRVFQNLSAGNHLLEVLAMDRNCNKAPASSRLEFTVIVPWIKDPRLLFVSAFALFVTLVLAGLAVNKHLQLKRSYAQVEKIVAERTRELERANQELLHSQKMRAIGTMAAGIAHDFNNILSIIKGSAQIIENDVEDKEKIRTRVGRIQTVVEQGSVIVKALLGLGKTDQTDLSDCNLSQLLDQTRKLLIDRFPESLRFLLHLSPTLPLVYCSPEALQQILLNLILNAADAMHNSGLVELSAWVTKILPRGIVLEPDSREEDLAEPSYIVISVTDHGAGISPENIPRIFEPFFTTKAFSSRRGTGLGLSMVYELAKAQGYGLAVETTPGRGSTFSLIVPQSVSRAKLRSSITNSTPRAEI